jgi:hypothetical protein
MGLRGVLARFHEQTYLFGAECIPESIVHFALSMPVGMLCMYSSMPLLNVHVQLCLC